MPGPEGSEGPYVANEDVVAWVTEHVDVDVATTRTILEVEFEWIIGAGIIAHGCPGELGHGCNHFTRRFHSREQLEEIDSTDTVDPEHLAGQTEALAGVPAPLALALAILHAATEYLTHRL